MIEVGSIVGNYKVTSKLGEGGMGVVYLAEHPVIGRKAALKAIHPQFARNAEVVSRFMTEAKSINQIGHRHIVDVTDFGQTAHGDLYFIMEYLEGRSLGEALAAEGRFAPERALHIAAQIADALQASHDHGVVHRDLKPDNTLLIAHGEDRDFVKVLDFGLAKLVGIDATPTHTTRTGSVMGTPYYMAPEQCEGTIEIDHRADIYSLGVILFEMLTGKVPFGGTGYGEVILKQMVARLPTARSIVPELPEALEAILARALAKDRELRFQSMSELRDALLDPAAYAAALPAHRVDDDHSGRIREATPMTRQEMSSLRTRLMTEALPSRPVKHGRGALLTAVAAAAFVLFAKTAEAPVAAAAAAPALVASATPVAADAPVAVEAPVAAEDAVPTDDDVASKTVSLATKPRHGRAHRRIEQPAPDLAVIGTDETMAPTFQPDTDRP